MGLRKGHCYNTQKDRPYTRKSKVRSKSYIKTVPQVKIAKFVMGDIKGFFNNKYSFILSLVALEPMQVRDNAIEASRQVVHRHLEKDAKGAYYFIVNVYPHPSRWMVVQYEDGNMEQVEESQVTTMFEINRRGREI